MALSSLVDVPPPESVGGGATVVLTTFGDALLRDNVAESVKHAWYKGGKLEAKPADMVTFDVPGDGKFKVLNTAERLQAFRAKVEKSPGFSDKGAPKPEQSRTNGPGMKTVPGTTFGVEKGSEGSRAAVTNMVEEGDFQAALDYATAKKVDMDALKLSKDDRTKLDAWLKDNPQATSAEDDVEAPAKKEALYASRPVTNAADIIAWAKSQGFKTTLPADDMHVTVAYSSTPMDGTKAGPTTGAVNINGGKRTVEPLGDGGAIVLKIESDELQARWKAYRDAGASWQPKCTHTKSVSSTAAGFR